MFDVYIDIPLPNIVTKTIKSERIFNNSENAMNLIKKINRSKTDDYIYK